MPTNITMPALSPTMETGTLARWLKKEGDEVKAGDIIAEIETDKATMEVEAVDEGTLARIVVPDGTEEVAVGAVIAVIAEEGEDLASVEAPSSPPSAAPKPQPAPAPPMQGGGETAQASAGQGQQSGRGGQAANPPAEVKGYGAQPAGPDQAVAQADAGKPNGRDAAAPAAAQHGDGGDRVVASPLARRLAEMRGLDLARLKGSGPGGRIVKADVDAAAQPGAGPQPAAAPQPAPQPAVPQARAPAEPPVPAQAPPSAPAQLPDIPHEAVKLSGMRKVIARRLTESKQTVPHYYLAIDVALDPLLKLRQELNASLEAQGVKLSVNDLLIKALAIALRQVPDANVSYTGESLLKFARADISVAVAIPAGLITPVIVNADGKRLSDIATEMKALAGKAKEGKLQPHEYQGGTASLSNLGMYGIKQFEAVINPPQGMILAVGAGEPRPYVVDSALAMATVMTATGSFDHRAVDGAVGAELMQAFKALVEKPLTMLA